MSERRCECFARSCANAPRSPTTRILIASRDPATGLRQVPFHLVAAISLLRSLLRSICKSYALANASRATHCAPRLHAACRIGDGRSVHQPCTSREDCKLRHCNELACKLEEIDDVSLERMTGARVRIAILFVQGDQFETRRSLTTRGDSATSHGSAQNKFPAIAALDAGRSVNVLLSRSRVSAR
jgi:hypothetical protein